MSIHKNISKIIRFKNTFILCFLHLFNVTNPTIIFYNLYMENRVKILREERNLTQKDLAEKVNSSQQLISLIEKENKGLTLELATKLADFFQVNTDYLLCRTNYVDSIKVETEIKQTADREKRILYYVRLLSTKKQIIIEQILDLLVRLLDKDD